VSQRIGRSAGSVLLALATAVVVLAVAILPFLNPIWVAFAQDRANALVWTQLSPDDLRSVTDQILHDLVLGPPTFNVFVDRTSVLSAAEQGHMRDVRNAMLAFGLIALVAAVALVVVHRLQRGSATFWRAVRQGAIGVVVGIVAIGAFALVAFDAAFELFHRILFPGGNFTFDPARDRLVQLFPMQFWFETAIAVGVVAVVIALALVRLSWPRARATGTSLGMAGLPLETSR
jgi:integral membrane protein (TIGR01906 family)